MSKTPLKKITLKTPNVMNYYIPLNNDKDRNRCIKRIERMVRNSMEYKDYIAFLKEYQDLNACIFFQNITSGTPQKKSHVSIEIHHEPFTLYDIVKTVLNKYEKEGYPINEFLISDEVLELHYKNQVGLVPLSKTAHQIVHNSNKLMIPLNMVYGEYSAFLEDYSDYVDQELYDKLEKKMQMTAGLTPESFDAIKKEFTYYEVEEFEDIEKLETKSQKEIA